MIFPARNLRFFGWISRNDRISFDDFDVLRSLDEASPHLVFQRSLGRVGKNPWVFHQAAGGNSLNLWHIAWDLNHGFLVDPILSLI